MVNKKAFPKVAKAIRFTKEELEFLADLNPNLTKAVQHCIRVAAAKQLAELAVEQPVGDGGAGKVEGDPF